MTGRKTARKHEPGFGRLQWGAIALGLLLVILAGEYAWAETQVEVVGIGYPPIQSSSTTQALLMARRAALLDAYRNALRATNQGPGLNEEGRLLEIISGTVRGSSVLAEEYLDDGGVRLRAKVTVDGPPAHRPEQGAYSARVSGPRMPKTVSLARWQEIIQVFVHFAPSKEGGDQP